MSSKLEKYNDEELFALLKKGGNDSKESFSEIYSRYSSKVYAYIRRMVETHAEAQDIFQECFLNFYKCIDAHHTITNILAFLLRIARNLSLTHIKVKSRHVEFDEYMHIDHDNRNENDELANLIKMALELIPTDLREMIVLREYEGLSYQDIADITEESLSNVKIKIYRGRQKMREILKPYFEEMPTTKAKTNT